MATITEMKKELIDNILAIDDENLLVDLSNFVTFRTETDEPIKLSKYQKLMLEMSEEDFKHGRIYTEDQINKMDEEEDLNEFQVLMLEKGIDDIKNGRVKTHKEVMENADKWLNSK